MTLKQISTIRSGYLIRPTKSNLKNEKVKYIQMKDIGNLGIVDLDSVREIDGSHLSKDSYLQKDDILFKSKSSSNESVIVPMLNVEAVASAHFFIIRVKKDFILPHFILWYLNLPHTQKYFENVAVGTSTKMISKKALGEVDIPVPEISIQKNIISIDHLAKKEQHLYKKIIEKKKDYFDYQLLKLAQNDK